MLANFKKQTLQKVKLKLNRIKSITLIMPASKNSLIKLLKRHGPGDFQSKFSLLCSSLVKETTYMNSNDVTWLSIMSLRKIYTVKQNNKG